MSEKEFPFVVRTLSYVQEEHPAFSSQWWRGKGNRVLFNLQLGEIRHVVVCDEAGKPLWDQPVHIEPVGAVTVAVTKSGKIRLHQQPRPMVLPKGVKPSFPEELPEEQWGRYFLDVPRGFPKRGETSKETAKRETFEETSSPVLSTEFLGEINANPTFFNHMVPVFLATINEDFEGEAPKDVNEKILKGDDYSIEEVKRLVLMGKIQDAITLAALNLYFQHLWFEEKLNNM